MRSLAFLQRRLSCFGTRNLAEAHLGRARHLLSSNDPADIYSALNLLDAALKLLPRWDKALELKARALLCLRRFKDVVNLLCDSIPSLKVSQNTFCQQENTSSEEVKLLLGNSPYPGALPDDSRWKKGRGGCLSQCLPPLKIRRKYKKLNKARCERDQWRYLVLGQACCHLGMMEDAKILLMYSKRAASAALRRQSTRFHDDGFCGEDAAGVDLDVLNHLLDNIKVLLRRRAAAIAAFEAGLYAESARHYSKILDGKRGTPQGFIAECYLHRARAFQADGRVIDAIADCNRTLILNPTCVEAFSMRASLYEMVGCFPEAVQDLEKLKYLYHSLLENEDCFEPRWVCSQNAARDMDFKGCIDFINGKLNSIREKLDQYGGIVDLLNPYIVLGVSRGCSRAELEKTYLVLSLKHRPDKAASFVDRCEFVDERDIEFVKEEARSLSSRLFHLIHKAYAGILSMVYDQDQVQSVPDGVQCAPDEVVCGDMLSFLSSCAKADHEDSGKENCGSMGRHRDNLYKKGEHGNDPSQFTNGKQVHQGFGFDKTCPEGSPRLQLVLQDQLFNAPSVDKEKMEFIDYNSLSLIGSWSDHLSADAGTMTCKMLSSEAWMNSEEWTHAVSLLSL